MRGKKKKILRSYLQSICNIRRNPSKESLCWPDGWTVYFFRVCLGNSMVQLPCINCPQALLPCIKAPLFHQIWTTDAHHEHNLPFGTGLQHFKFKPKYVLQNCLPCNSTVFPAVFPAVWSWATEANLILPNTSFSPETHVKTEHKMHYFRETP